MKYLHKNNLRLTINSKIYINFYFYIFIQKNNKIILVIINNKQLEKRSYI